MLSIGEVVRASATNRDVPSLVAERALDAACRDLPHGHVLLLDGLKRASHVLSSLFPLIPLTASLYLISLEGPRPRVYKNFTARRKVLKRLTWACHLGATRIAESVSSWFCVKAARLASQATVTWVYPMCLR